jgi:hypothetical protein
MNRLLFVVFLCSHVAFAQVVIQEQDIMNIIGPASGSHYFTPGYEGTINIGTTGGPNIYDFSGLSVGSPEISYNYTTSSIPLLAPRYPAGSFTFGESPSTIEKNPVFASVSGTLSLAGEATTLAPTLKFGHRSPFITMLSFPTVYGASTQQVVDHFDSSYNTSGQLLLAEHHVSTETGVIDGYGTLRVMGFEFSCLRVRTEHNYGSPSDVKEFFYFTREGLLVLVRGIPLSAPNSGTHQARLQVLLAPSLVGVKPGTGLPSSYVLNQNYPNPFNPTTSIGFTLAQRAHVRLEVFNVLGQLVSTMVNEMREAGQYTERFDAGRLPGGMYFYRLEAGTFAGVRKLVLLK